jgi:VIT1/CCC1 family predicted Fe2+/Mn2+ transporter
MAMSGHVSVHGEHHADVSGGWLRPAVFGAMDGLVSNIALVAGVAGGGVGDRTILLAGIAGLVAGSVSMAFGEYTSVRTQNEQLGHEIAMERRELRRNPEAEEAELAGFWRANGLPDDLARQAAAAVSVNPEQALRVHVQAELGVDPDAVASPWAAALMSLWCFALGALLPILPYVIGQGSLEAALASGTVGLFLAGAIVARWTHRPWWLSGLRQLALGVTAAAVTYFIGSLVGVGLG